MIQSQRASAPRSTWFRAVAWILLPAVVLSAPGALGAQPSNYQVIVLHPSGFTNSGAFGISDGARATGVGWNLADMSDMRALLWGGAGTQVTSLKPGPSVASWGWSLTADRVAGNVWTPGTTNSSHATAWLADGSRITLTPQGFGTTTAYDVSDTLIVGNGGGPAT